MGPGVGVYLPSYVPHWVETEAGVSVSFSIPFFTAYAGGRRACTRSTGACAGCTSRRGRPGRLGAGRQDEGGRVPVVAEAARGPAQAPGLGPRRAHDERAGGRGARRPVDVGACAATGSSSRRASRRRRTSRRPTGCSSWWETIAARAQTRGGRVARASGRLEALVALSRERERLHRALPIDCRSTSTRAAAPGPPTTAAGSCPRAGATRSPPGSPTPSGGAGLLLRSADPAWGRPPLPPRRRVVASTACPRMSVPPPGSARWAARTRFSRQLARFTRRLEREGVRFEWVAAGAVDERLSARPFSRCMRGRVRAMESRSSFGVEQLELHGRLAERSGAGRGPDRRGGAPRRRRRRSPLRLHVEGHLRRLPVGMGARDGIATAWAACSPTRPFASPRHTASARSTSCAAPSRTSIASEPPTGGIGRGCCRTDRAARCLRLDIERATWLIGRAVTPLFVERDGPRTAARRGPPDARP